MSGKAQAAGSSATVAKRGAAADGADAGGSKKQKACGKLGKVRFSWHS